MKDVVATVSGYGGWDRIRLVGLIVHLGAFNTGSLSSCNTHLVCWKFQGPKFELAKKLGTKIISHRWFEDCLMAGILLPEEPYIGKSGENEPPLFLEDEVFELYLRERPKKVKSNEGHGPKCPDSDQEKVRLREKIPIREAKSLDGSLQAAGSNRPLSSRSSDPPDLLDRLGVSGNPSLSHDDVHSGLVSSLKDLEHVTGARIEEQPPAAGNSRQEDALDDFNPCMDDHHHEMVKDYKISNKTKPVKRSAADRLEMPYQLSPPEVCAHNEQPGSKDENRRSAYSHLRSKRKETEVPVGGLSEKYRRLVHGSSASAVSNSVSNVDMVEAGRSPHSSHLLKSQFVLHSASENPPPGGPCEENKREDKSQSGSVKEVYISPRKDIACVICHTETKPTTEGLLECGHRYCYECIQKWADEGSSRQSTCPLCKASFEFITIRELQRSVSAEICTQVLDERVVMVRREIRQGQKINLLTPTAENLCIICESRDSPELLIICSRCNERSCHTVCLDPPLPPGSSWSCHRCTRYSSRERIMSRLST